MMLLMVLRGDDGRDVELQTVQIELHAAAGNLGLHGRAEIVDIVLGGLLRVGRLQMDMLHCEGH